MRPLDFIKTKKGNIGMIKEVDPSGHKASIRFLGTFEGEKEAWWEAWEFDIIDSLPDLLARNLPHPFSTGSLQPFKLSLRDLDFQEIKIMNAEEESKVDIPIARRIEIAKRAIKYCEENELVDGPLGLVTALANLGYLDDKEPEIREVFYEASGHRGTPCPNKFQLPSPLPVFPPPNVGDNYCKKCTFFRGICYDKQKVYCVAPRLEYEEKEYNMRFGKTTPPAVSQPEREKKK